MRSHISNAFASVRLRREAIFDRCGGNVRGQIGAYTVPTRSLRTAEPDPRELGFGGRSLRTAKPDPRELGLEGRSLRTAKPDPRELGLGGDRSALRRSCFAQAQSDPDASGILIL